MSRRGLRDRLGDLQMRLTLASPGHSRNSADTLTLEVAGRRRGRRYRLPVSFVEDDRAPARFAAAGPGFVDPGLPPAERYSPEELPPVAHGCAVITIEPD